MTQFYEEVFLIILASSLTFISTKHIKQTITSKERGINLKDIYNELYSDVFYIQVKSVIHKIIHKLNNLTGEELEEYESSIRRDWSSTALGRITNVTIKKNYLFKI